MNNPCPICHNELRNTDTPGLSMCQRQSVFVPELNSDIETVHALIFTNDNGHQVFKIIAVPPYSFEIHDDPGSMKQTRIVKTTNVKFGTADHLVQEVVMTVPGIVHCQWDDKQQVIEKIKLLSLFS